MIGWVVAQLMQTVELAQVEQLARQSRHLESEMKVCVGHSWTQFPM